jgi:hypothetical protein
VPLAGSSALVFGVLTAAFLVTDAEDRSWIRDRVGYPGDGGPPIPWDRQGGLIVGERATIHLSIQGAVENGVAATGTGQATDTNTQTPQPSAQGDTQGQPAKAEPAPETTQQENQNNKKPCFAAGTPIRTPWGSLNIENIRPGDLVLSRSEHDLRGIVESKVVEEVFANAGAVWHLHAGGQVIRTAATHPFFVAGRGWVACNELKIGDYLLNEDGTWVAVEDLLDTGEYETLYNFRVADHHTYFVGCDEWGFSVWAHNACVTLYHESGGNYPEQMRHWAIYVESKAENLYGDMGNTKGNEPQGKDRMKLEAWIAWGDDNKIKAWFRTFPNPKAGMIASKPMEITEEVAAKAIQKMRDMEKATAGKVRWSMDGNSCFEFVAQVLRVAKPDLGLPGPPNGSEERREALLEALRNVMNES